MSVAGAEGTLDHLLKKLGRADTPDRFRLVCLLSLSGNVLECSPSTLERAGLTHPDIVGRPLWTTMWWEAAAAAREQVRQAVLRAAQGDFVRCDVVSQVDNNATGTVLLDLTVAPVRSDDPAVAWLLVEARDVISTGGEPLLTVRGTELLADEVREEIERSEERFRAFVTATSDVIYQMSPDWSDMRHLHGRDFIADTTDPSRDWLHRYIHPDDHEAVLRAIAEAIRTKTTFEMEHRVIRVDGSLGWTYSRAVPRLSADGEVIEWIGAARDVSERKLAEEEIARLTADSEQQRRLYEAIVSSTPDLVYVFDRDHRFVFANDALLKMWGKTREEALGKNCLELGYEPWHAEMHDREIEEAVSSRCAVRGEVPFNGTAGRRIYDYIFVPVVSANGEVELIAGTTRDVTDRKMTEEELRRVNHDLEQFAYSASHDLKEPLRTVKIYSELLVGRYRHKLDGTALFFLDNVRAGADRMESLVRDLLAYTQASRVEMPCEPTDAMAALESALANLEAALAESGGVVQAGALPHVSVHAAQLQSLFQNLIGNALKYRRPEVAPVVSISARRQDGFWLFCVADNGIGIEPEFREQIFGLFKRLHSSDEYSGTGIGLAICKRIVERYRGRIWVGPEAGEGCRFYFTLPG